MIYWGRRKTDHWVEPTDCNKFVVWDVLWPSPAPTIDTTSQLRHRCSGFVWARHALIEPPVEGHKAIERKRFAPLPFARGSCPPFPRKPRQLRRAAGVSVVCEAESAYGDRDVGPQTHRAQCAAPPTCEPRKRLPYRTPRYTRPHGYQNTQHTNARRGCANDAARLRSRTCRGPFCPVALGPHAPGQRVQLPVRVAFGPQPGRQHRVAHRGPGRSLQAPGTCHSTD